MGGFGRAAAIAFFAALVLYSALLLGLELATSQAYVRPFFADIVGPVPFFAVNTTLSSGLLAGSALLLLFAAAMLPPARLAEPPRPFLLAQAALFAMLAADDRFQLHEIADYRLGLAGDHWVLIGMGLAQLALLAAFFRPRHTSRRAILLFLAGGACAGVMLIFDIFIPARASLRLSLEDLSKAWGAAFFFAAAWDTARFQVRREGGEGSGTPPNSTSTTGRL